MKNTILTVVLSSLLTLWIGYTVFVSYQLWIGKNQLKPSACFAFDADTKQWQPLKGKP